MKELIRYLAELECTAGNLYADAAEYFSTDRELSLLLKDLEQDEIRHYDIMNRISDLLTGDIQDFTSDIVVDSRAWKRLEGPLLGFREHLTHGTLTQEELFEYLAAIEFSEWNSIFIYIIDVLNKYSMEFRHIAGQLEAHMNKISKFIADKPDLDKHLRRSENDDPIQKVKVLIVDDEPAMVNLLVSFLGKKYDVDSALDGEEALQKIISQYYDVIISDIHMPGLTGIDILKEAENMDKDIGKRFIFISGDLSPAYKKIFEQNDIFYLYKPVSLDVVEDRIREVLKQS